MFFMIGLIEFSLMFCVLSVLVGLGGLIVFWFDILNIGGMLVIDVIVMWLVRKWLIVRLMVFVLFVCSLVFGDVNDGGSCSGVLIGVGVMLVVIGVLFCCGMMWN